MDKYKLEDFTIRLDATIIEALERINKNKRGFLIVVDQNQKVLGTLSDGDLRRAFISIAQKGAVDLKGMKIAEYYSKNFTGITCEETLSKLIESFKNERINFIPILDSRQKLVNIITKKQMHLELTRDQKIDLKDQKLLNVFENAADNEVYGRPWGYYKTLLKSEHQHVKVIVVYPNEETSLQSHQKREEFWVIVKGRASVSIDLSKRELGSGEYIFVPKGSKHRISNKGNENLIIIEVQLGDYFGEDDIIRYEDKYQRI